MLPGAAVYMSEKSAYVNTTLFLRWLEEMFVPRKPNGKVVLVLDGHASHCTSVELLELADANDVVLICLPSHTTHFLQPLDRAVFKSLKSNFYNACRNWIRTNPGRQIKRSQFGNLLSQSWGISATQNNAIAGFKATGICPFNSEAIPEHAYEISDQSVENPQAHNEAVSQSQSGAHKTLTQESAHSESMNVKPGTSKTTFVQRDENINDLQMSYFCHLPHVPLLHHPHQQH
ncbi:dde superfamily endonuclease [Holotrichia oblita]|uniref:Dde superfamily endonuclease n=1 Tax=Holotrichia oblita TaxID=644536 RepID=A0ACB9TS05_HOLOL|nr:dde superfamily endonuclease [Holotrichia oblita]